MVSGNGANDGGHPVRVLFSFPNKLGAQRICYTAWEQVNGLAAAGADITVFTGGLMRPVHPSVRVETTLARGRLRIPYKLIGSRRALSWHDFVVSRKLVKAADRFDIIHTWPSGAARTLRVASTLGIPTVLERPNAHTRFAMEVVKRECERLQVSLPRRHEHAQDAAKLRLEEEEFRLAYCLLCPSDFVARTFREQGFPERQLARHQYGFDDTIYFPGNPSRDPARPLTMLFVGGCAPRKGLHYALEAWLRSPASRDGKFLIVGGFIPGYAEKLGGMLSDSSIRVLGHRNDVAQLMRESDVLTLPSLEEGSALVTLEGRGSGCVLLVSDAAGAICKHMENALVHKAGDVEALSRHITMVHKDRGLLERLRVHSLATVCELTWSAAAERLLKVYRETIAMYRQDKKQIAKPEVESERSVSRQ